MTRDKQRKALIEKHKNKSGWMGKITAMCISCIYDPYTAGNGTWRKQVEDCTSRDCPLYDVRPKRLPAKPEEGGHDD